MKVLIVGAGPTGLTAAVELERRGIETKVVDKRPDGSGFSRAVGIIPRSLKLLGPSSITDSLLEDGIKMADFHIFIDARRKLSLNTRGTGGVYDFILALPQDRTEAIMRKRLAELGRKVTFDKALTGFEQSVEGVTAVFADGTTERFDYLVGADGAHSKTRKFLELPFYGYDLPETWSIADVEARDWPYRNAFVISALSDGKVAVVAHIGKDRYRVISDTPDALQTLALPLDVTEIHRQGTFAISVRQVETYQVGRVLLAGDAAHCHSPVGGRGMNLGIADAADLARRMDARDLSGYSAARHAEGKKVIADSEAARKMITSGSPGRRIIFRSALTAVKLLPGLRRRAIHSLLRG